MMSPSTGLQCKLFVLDLFMSQLAVVDVLQSVVHIQFTVSCVSHDASSVVLALTVLLSQRRPFCQKLLVKLR